jgi:hypothetical protein
MLKWMIPMITPKGIPKRAPTTHTIDTTQTPIAIR